MLNMNIGQSNGRAQTLKKLSNLKIALLKLNLERKVIGSHGQPRNAEISFVDKKRKMIYDDCFECDEGSTCVFFRKKKKCSGIYVKYIENINNNVNANGYQTVNQYSGTFNRLFFFI